MTTIKTNFYDFEPDDVQKIYNLLLEDVKNSNFKLGVMFTANPSLLIESRLRKILPDNCDDEKFYMGQVDYRRLAIDFNQSVLKPKQKKKLHDLIVDPFRLLAERKKENLDGVGAGIVKTLIKYLEIKVKKHLNNEKDDSLSGQLKKWAVNALEDESDQWTLSRVPDEKLLFALCSYIDDGLRYRIQAATGLEVYASELSLKTVTAPRHKISDRLGSGGLRDLANQASQMPSGAGGDSPRQKAEFRQSRPATRKL